MENFEQAIMRERKFLDNQSHTMDLVMFDMEMKDIFAATKDIKNIKYIVEEKNFIYKFFGT
jgi:hypothetical protein